MTNTDEFTLRPRVQEFLAEAVRYQERQARVSYGDAGGLAKGMGALLHNSIHAPMNSVSKGKPV